ncbi:MAG: hypothetical protein QM730_20110 [Anaerolineales bacterium]
METEPILQPQTYARPNANDMRRCEVCGNEYDKCMEIRVNGMTHVFDSFECAVHALAPSCAHCGCKILGHGMEFERCVLLLCPLCQSGGRA